MGEDAPLDALEMTASSKKLIRTSWNVILSEIRQTLCYFGDSQVDDSPAGEGVGTGTTNVEDSGGVSRQMLKVSSVFIYLFEDYPSVQQYFTKFHGTSAEEIQLNVKQSQELQDHALQVFQFVGKVIRRMDPTLQTVS